MTLLNSLRKQFYVFLLLPVALLLGVFIAVGYSQFRQILFQEWQATALGKLEQAALQLELRLDKFRQWLKLFNQASLSARSEELQAWFLQQLREQEGLMAVRLVWHDAPSLPSGQQAEAWPVRKSLSLTPGRFDTDPDAKTVIVQGQILDQLGREVGSLAIVLRWSQLLEGLFSSPWYQNYDTVIIDENHRFLFHTNPTQRAGQVLGESGNELELAILRNLTKKSSGLILGEGKAAGWVAGFYRLPQTPWVLLLFAQQRQVLAPVLRFQYYYIAAGVICALAVLVLLRQLICPIIMSIREISRATLHVAEGHYGQPLPEERQDELGQLTRNFNKMVAGLKERDYIKDTFGRYVDPEVARELLSRPEAALLGGERRFVAILFADLREFTPLAESLSPEATINLINRFFSRMVEAIRIHKGIIVDFFGDGLLAFFEPLAGEELGQCVDRGRRCAVEMQAAMQELNLAGERLGYPPLQLGIGLHAGTAVVGNIGSQTRAKYGIVGSSVNLTHRIQAQAQGGEVVLSAEAYERITPPPPLQRKFQVELKGVKGVMTLYAISTGQV